MSWKSGYASIQGTSHKGSNLPCQDASICRSIAYQDKKILLAVACDGAGSAKKADFGAQLVSEYFADLAETFIADKGIEAINAQIIKNWLEDCRFLVVQDAIECGSDKREYACTFICAIMAPEKNIFVQIGDGAIVVLGNSESEDYKFVFWPQKGQYHNTTNFITDDDFILNLDIKINEDPVTDIALFTDGIESIALKFDTREAYDPFFRMLFDSLKRIPDENLWNKAIAQFLESERVNERTDDDKTLILATYLDN